MFRDLFSNRLFIGALVFFVLIVVGGTLYLRHIENEAQQERAHMQEAVKQWEQRNTKPAETARVPEGGTSQVGHWHGDEWHAQPHTPVEVEPLSPENAKTLKTIDWKHLTPNDLMYLLEKERWPHLTQAQREIVHREFYAQSFGVEPPPEGYYYRVQEDGSPVLDDNGKPRLFKEGEPIITVKKRIGFAPTREQYKQYKELVAKHDRAYLAGNTAEATKIKSQIRQLKAEARGEVPLVTSSLMAPTSQYAAARAAANLKINKISDQAYRDMGLGYMVDED